MKKNINSLFLYAMDVSLFAKALRLAQKILLEKKLAQKKVFLSGSSAFEAHQISWGEGRVAMLEGIFK